MIAPEVLAFQPYPAPEVVYVAPPSGDKVTVRGFYVVARCRALAGPFTTARDAEKACRALGGSR